MNAVFKSLKKLVDFLSSFGLAGVVFLLLLVLTYLGTVEQIEHGLYETQKKYFESLFVTHAFFDKVPVVLPGVYLLLIILFINILLGGIVRLRRGWSQLGIFTSHIGILLLLLGGFITYRYSIDGHMTLYENQSANVFKSYHEWELAIAERNDDGTATEFVVPGKSFSALQPGESTVLDDPELPFEITLSDFAPNSEPRKKGPMVDVESKMVDGVYLERLPNEKNNEANVAGVYATVKNRKDGQVQEAVLWGFQKEPAPIEVDGKRWTLDLRRRQWEVPFTVRLDKFTRELHPRTNMPSVFKSEITKTEGGVDQRVEISMNNPLRHKGFTFFQASWGPDGAPPGTPLFSTFAVVRNPADKFPLYACVVITAGMLIHFSMKLRRYLRAETRRRA